VSPTLAEPFPRRPAPPAAGLATPPRLLPYSSLHSFAQSLLFHALPLAMRISSTSSLSPAHSSNRLIATAPREMMAGKVWKRSRKGVASPAADGAARREKMALPTLSSGSLLDYKWIVMSGTKPPSGAVLAHTWLSPPPCISHGTMRYPYGTSNS
jgi:hypothetical protein